MLVILANEPFSLSISELKALTPRQISILYLRERDEHGRVILDDLTAQPVGDEEIYQRWCDAHNVPLLEREGYRKEYIRQAKAAWGIVDDQS